MSDDVERRELQELAQRIEPGAQVVEKTVEEGTASVWRLMVEAPNIARLEVRSPDRARARRVIRTALVEQLGERGLLRPNEVDSPDFADELADNQRAYTELATVLDAAGKEEEIQKVLARNPEAWKFLTSTRPQVIPKMPLGEHVTDFVVFGAMPWSQSQRPVATFIEIERADVPLFTANGDPSYQLTHAQRQVRNWKQWISDNKQQVRDYLVNRTYLSWDRSSTEGQPGGAPAYGFDDRYLLVIGRRTGMTPAQRWQLHQICEEFPKTITYDMLLDALCPEAPHRPPWVFDD